MPQPPQKTQPDARVAAALEDLVARLVNTPMAIAPEHLRSLIAMRRDQDVDPAAFFSFFFDEPETSAEQEGVALIRIRGALWRGSYYDDYRTIRHDLDDALANPSVRGVIFDIDSPGGPVPGCFDLVDHIHASRGTKPLWAFVNDQGLSAAYAIASAADRVFTSDTGMVGSIGVLAVHVDQSKSDRDRGVKFTEVASGRHKTELSRHKPLSRDGLNTINRMVDTAFDAFVERVARNRGLEEDAIRAQEAGVFFGDDAFEAGLADAHATLDQLVERIASGSGPMRRPSRTAPGAVSGGPRAASPGTQQENETMTEPTTRPAGADPATQPDPPPTQPAPAAAAPPQAPAAPDPAPAAPAPAAAPAAPAGGAEVVSIDEARSQGRASERARMQGINDLCTLAGCPDKAMAFVSQDLSVDQVREKLLAARTSAAGPEIDGHPPGGGADVPTINTAAVYDKWNGRDQKGA